MRQMNLKATQLETTSETHNGTAEARQFVKDYNG
jgi:hypothetical protein